VKKDEPFVFDGFEPANTTPLPDVLFDQLLTRLTGAELKVLLYIMRRTWGFKKDTDAISYSQFQNGIITKEGKVLDEGCGIKRRETISEALDSLEAMGCITSQKGKETAGDNATSIYSIHFKEVVSKPDYLHAQGGFKTGLPVVSKPDYGSPKRELPVVSKPDTQETVLQDTDSQETVRQEESIAPASLSAFAERKKITGEHPAITKEMLAEKVIAPKITLPSKQTSTSQSQVNGAPDSAPPASVGKGTAQAGAREELPAMALTAKQIKQQNERRAKEIWAIVERELKTKFMATQRKSDNNTKGMENLIEDEVSDETLTAALKAMPLFYVQQFNLKKFHEMIPGLTSTRDTPPQNGKAPAPANVTTMYRNKSEELAAQREKYAAQGGY